MRSVPWRDVAKVSRDGSEEGGEFPGGSWRKVLEHETSDFLNMPGCCVEECVAPFVCESDMATAALPSAFHQATGF